MDTPEPLLNAAVAAVCHPMDAACDRNPTIFRHGCMSFHIHFLGWRVICGSTALGWHDRVKGNAEFYLAHQVQEDPERIKPEPDAGPAGRPREQPVAIPRPRQDRQQPGHVQHTDAVLRPDHPRLALDG